LLARIDRLCFRTVTGLRSYGDPCGIARALDLVGERWALLLVRELLLGPKRFTDLRTGLPDASPNVLSQRLGELEEAGVVRRRKLDPPAGSWVYELTEWGSELRPVVIGLGRWGSRSPARPRGELSPDALMLALETTFVEGAAAGVRASLDVRLGVDRFRLRVSGKRLAIERGVSPAPDAVIETDGTTLRRVVFSDRTLADAERSGDVRIEGDRRAAAKVLGLFARPAPAL
jgi:DNA-binding HxlR family transcriptional regulator